MESKKLVVSNKVDYKYEKDAFYFYSESKIIKMSKKASAVFMSILKGDFILEENICSSYDDIITELTEKQFVEYGDENLIYKKNKYTFLFELDDEFFVVNYLYKTFDKLRAKTYEKFITNDFKNMDIDERTYYIARRYIDTHDYDYEKYIDYGTYETIYVAFSYACNLKCVYCFEANNNKALSMNNDIFEKTIKYIDDICKEKKTKIVFYGGEPILLSNINYIKNILSRYKNNSNVFFEFITNGTNIEMVGNIIEEYRNKLSKMVITIDGTKDVHDSRRMYKDGGGTFDKIIKSLKTLNDRGIRVTIRANIDKENYDEQSKLLRILETRLNNKKIIDIEYHRVEDKESGYSGVKLVDMYLLIKELKGKSNINIMWAEPLYGRLMEIEENKIGYPIIQKSYCDYENMHVIDPIGRVSCCNETNGDNRFFLRDNISEIRKMNYRSECQKCDMWLVCYGGCNLYYNNMKANEKDACLKQEYIKVLEMFISDLMEKTNVYERV